MIMYDSLHERMRVVIRYYLLRDPVAMGLSYIHKPFLRQQVSNHTTYHFLIFIHISVKILR
jgi:hypothetical protein